MVWQFPPYIILLILSTLISAGLALYAWQRRQTPGSVPFALLMLAVSLWSFSYALGLMSTNLSTIYFWAKVEYLGIVFIPALWLHFAIQYTGREQWLTERNLILLGIVPVIILGLMWTNEFHNLFYAEIGLTIINSFVIMTLSPGVVYWLNVLYTYLLFAAGVILFVQMAAAVSRPYRRQIAIIVGGMLIIFAASILYLLGFTPIPYLELEPMVFTLTGLVIAWGLFRYDLFNIVPVAREKIVENMSDGVIVFDTQNRVVDVNAAAQKLMDRRAADVIGTPIEQLPLNHIDLVERFRDVVDVHSQLVLGEPPDQHYFDVRISPLYGRKEELTGRMVVLRDITQLKQTEQKLQQRNQELALLNWVGRTFSATLDLDEVLDLVLQETRHLLNVETASFWLKMPDTGELICQRATGSGYEIVHQWRLSPGQGLVGWVAEKGRSIIVDDAQSDERHFKDVDKQTGLTLRSILSIPLLLKDEVVGVLNLADTEAGRFTQEDLTMLEPLTMSAAIAIENARLHTALQTELDKRQQAEVALRQLNDELEQRVEQRTQELQAEITERQRVQEELQSSLEKMKISYEQATIYARQLTEEITERKQAQTELKRRHEDLVALNTIITMIGQSRDLSHILTTALDLVLAIVEAPAGYVQLLNDDLSRLALVVHKGLRPETIETIETAQSACLPLTGGETDPFTSGQAEKVSPAVGLAGWHALHKIPLRYKDGVLGCIQILNHEPRMLDEEQVQLLAAIGHQVGVAIENERLTKEAAEVRVSQELDHLRAELIGNVSHELRTPLGLIKAASTTLLAEDVSFAEETQKLLLRGIDEETDRLEHIVNNLLDLSRLEQKRFQLDLSPTDIAQLAGNIIKTMTPHLPPNLHIDSNFPTELLTATVDAKRIEQVFRNLLTNAIKYSPEGGSIIVAGEKDGQGLFIQVRDQGIGIRLEDQKNIFERFYRADNEITQSISGVGLGLSISQAIIKAHGGHLGVESEWGGGSTFYFTLPANIFPEA